MAARKRIPATAQPEKKMPDTGMEEKSIPDVKMETKELPVIGKPENTVTIGGELIEIKPTKLKYQRNKTALFYKVFDMLPLTDILAMDAGAFGDDRDGDKCVMDFLIAVTDNEKLIADHYDEMDTDTVYKILAIFRRINKIDEKEANAKNANPPRENKAG